MGGGPGGCGTAAAGARAGSGGSGAAGRRAGFGSRIRLFVWAWLLLPRLPEAARGLRRSGGCGWRRPPERLGNPHPPARPLHSAFPQPLRLRLCQAGGQRGGRALPLALASLMSHRPRRKWRRLRLGAVLAAAACARQQPRLPGTVALGCGTRGGRTWGISPLGVRMLSPGFWPQPQPQRCSLEPVGVPSAGTGVPSGVSAGGAAQAPQRKLSACVPAVFPAPSRLVLIASALPVLHAIGPLLPLISAAQMGCERHVGLIRGAEPWGWPRPCPALPHELLLHRSPTVRCSPCAGWWGRAGLQPPPGTGRGGQQRPPAPQLPSLCRAVPCRACQARPFGPAASSWHAAAPGCRGPPGEPQGGLVHGGSGRPGAGRAGSGSGPGLCESPRPTVPLQMRERAEQSAARPSPARQGPTMLRRLCCCCCCCCERQGRCQGSGGIPPARGCHPCGVAPGAALLTPVCLGGTEGHLRCAGGHSDAAWGSHWGARGAGEPCACCWRGSCVASPGPGHVRGTRPGLNPPQEPTGGGAGTPGCAPGTWLVE